MSIVEVNNFSKDYVINKHSKGALSMLKNLIHTETEIKHAVQDVSFSIDEGEIVGYIGPNGSGKSTTIKSLVGIMVPTSGDIRVNGLVPYKNRKLNAKNVGAIFGQRSQLWWDIPVYESLNMMKYIYKIDAAKFKQNLDMFTDILDMGSYINMPVRQLSLGQRIRADICMGLLHEPKVLYLDEPTIGLDVVVKNSIRELILEINKTKNTTVILTTHDVADIEKLCKRVILINKGKLEFDGDINNMKKMIQSEEVLDIETFEENIQVELFQFEALVQISKEASNRVKFTYDNNKISASYILQSVIEKYKVKDFKVSENSLEDTLRKLYVAREK